MPIFFLIAAAGLISCGRPPLTGGRPYPPDFDGYGYPRAMVAEAQAGKGQGQLQLIDVEHDTVSNRQDTDHSYTISGYGGTNPLTIQDFPGQQLAYIFADGGNAPFSTTTFQPVNTGTDSSQTPIAAVSPGTTSAYITNDLSYVYSVSPTVQHSTVGYLSVYSLAKGELASIPLPNASKLAPSPGAVNGSSTLLILAANANAGQNNVYQLTGIGQTTAYYDCTQQILPTSVGGGMLSFDHPVNAVYSNDGTSAFVLNCGPECGGATSGITILNTASLAAGAATAYVPQFGCNISFTPSPLQTPAINVPVPGGATTAFQLGNTLFVAGQSLQNGRLAGVLTAINLTTLATQTTLIGDGNHFRMRFADNNTLWIAANGSCNEGYEAQNGGATGCITMVQLTPQNGGATYSITSPITPPAFANPANGSPTIPLCQVQAALATPTAYPCTEPNQGVAGGLAPIVGYNKIYTTEGGFIFIYSTAGGSAISNINVQVPGYANDISFIDGTTNSAP